MDPFRDKNQLCFETPTENYFKYTLQPDEDVAKVQLRRPLEIPIFKLSYRGRAGKTNFVNVYPTLQFLYSHHVQGEYITEGVRSLLKQNSDEAYYKKVGFCVGVFLCCCYSG